MGEEAFRRHLHTGDQGFQLASLCQKADGSAQKDSSMPEAWRIQSRRSFVCVTVWEVCVRSQEIHPSWWQRLELLQSPTSFPCTPPWWWWAILGWVLWTYDVQLRSQFSWTFKLLKLTQSIKHYRKRKRREKGKWRGEEG